MERIIFTHEAIGQDSRTITVYKFRTMRGAISPQRDANLSLSGKLDRTDRERLTLVGRMLRPTGIDEIPQIYNLLWHKNMQIIGIRPFLPEEFTLLPKDLQKSLTSQKPGIIPAEAYYGYRPGDLDSRIAAIDMYVQEDPRGLKRCWVGFVALIKRWLRYSSR